MSLPGPLVAIVGPTASGKSELADRVAQALGSSVVSIDAMQVYRGMDVGTAKTPVDERRRPLLMVDVVDITCDYSAQRFQRAARQVIDDLLADGVTPVLCGGTGLYLNAVIDDMRFPSGAIGGTRRRHYEQLLDAMGADALHAELARRDPQSARLIHPHNARRVIRALEMQDEGRSYAQHHQGLHVRRPWYDARIWGIELERDELYRRIDRRVDEMFAHGLVEEVERLFGQGLRERRTASQAIGYKEVLQALDGELTLDEAREVIKRRTRRYAKRQISWFSHDERVRWIRADDLERAVSLVVDEVSSEGPEASKDEDDGTVQAF